MLRSLVKITLMAVHRPGGTFVQSKCILDLTSTEPATQNVERELYLCTGWPSTRGIKWRALPPWPKTAESLLQHSSRSVTRPHWRRRRPTSAPLCAPASGPLGPRPSRLHRSRTQREINGGPPPCGLPLFLAWVYSCSRGGGICLWL